MKNSIAGNTDLLTDLARQKEHLKETVEELQCRTTTVNLVFTGIKETVRENTEEV